VLPCAVNRSPQPALAVPPRSSQNLASPNPFLSRSSALFSRVRIPFIPQDLRSLCFQSLMHSFALPNSLSPAFSTASALFPQNRGEWGMPSVFSGLAPRSINLKSLPPYLCSITSLLLHFPLCRYLLSFHILRRPLPTKSFRITFFQKTGGRGGILASSRTSKHAPRIIRAISLSPYLLTSSSFPSLYPPCLLSRYPEYLP